MTAAAHTLETERLVGEPVSWRHRDVALALFGEPRVAEWIWPGDLGGPRTPAQVDAILTRFIGHWDDHGFGWWYLRERSSGQYVGEVGLQRTETDGEQVVEIGWTVLPVHWRRGLATEAAASVLDHAFERAGLDEVVAFTLPHNRASRRVMEKLGMEQGGDTLRAGLPHVLYRLSREAHGVRSRGGESGSREAPDDESRPSPAQAPVRRSAR